MLKILCLKIFTDLTDLSCHATATDFNLFKVIDPLKEKLKDNLPAFQHFFQIF